MSLEHDNARIHKLIEREKELNCIYQIENIIRNDTLTIDQILARLVEIIPSGWQYPELCRCSITYEGNVYSGAGFDSTGNGQKSEILVGDHIAGHIEVEYDYDTGKPEKPGFLPEEQKLLNTIAGILGMTIFSRKLRSTLEYLKNARSKSNFQVNEDQILSPDSDRHWKWRYDMVNIIAEHLEMDRFGVKGMYLIGSTKNATAGPGSDIDLLIHIDGDHKKNENLRYWLEGWGYCMGIMNFNKTGYADTGNLIDLHMVTDEDIRKKDSYACLINAITDRARPIKMNIQH